MGNVIESVIFNHNFIFSVGAVFITQPFSCTVFWYCGTNHGCGISNIVGITIPYIESTVMFGGTIWLN